MREVKKPYYVVNLSGGKDSTAMLLKMLEVGYPVNDIITFITGMEFDEQLEHLKLLEKREGITIQRIKISPDPKQTFIFDMLYRKVKAKDGRVRSGYGFPSHFNRWCTARYKRDLSARYARELSVQGYQLFNYIGIAYDERQRKRDAIYPLIDWKWSEKDCLDYCYSRGYDFGGLYKKFKRISCWCCPLQCMSDFQTLFEEYSDKWKELQEWQKIRPDFPYKVNPDRTIAELEECFKKKDYRAYKREKLKG